MSETARQLLEQIRALPENDRALLADELLADDGGGYDPFADPEWRAELDRRIAEVAEGNVQSVSLDDALDAIERRLASQVSV